MINEAASSVSLEGIAAGVRAADTVIKAQLADVFAQRRSIEVAFDYLDVGEVAVAQSLAHDRVTGPGIVRVCRAERWDRRLAVLKAAAENPSAPIDQQPTNQQPGNQNRS